MKKFIVLLMALAIASAAPYTVSNYGAAGGGNATCNIAAQAGRQIQIWSIMGTSDKAGSVITVQKGAAAGVTTNYTTLGTLANGAATTKTYQDIAPIIVLPVNTQARFTLDSTTANSLFVTYEYK